MAKLKRTDALTGSTGVYCVAAQINSMGYHAALTIRSVPHVDILAGTLDGSHSCGIQVKTARWAHRHPGSEDEQYQFAMSDSSWNAALKSKNLLFAFVDLHCDHGKTFTELPDIFIVPTTFLRTYYRKTVKHFGGDPAKWKWKRLHAPASSFDKFKNNWTPLKASLRAKS